MTTDSDNSEFETRRTIIDPGKVLAIVLRRWYIIAISLTLFLVGTFLQLRYTKPLYRASITLKLDDEKPSSVSDIIRFGRASGRFDNFLKTESEALHSKHFAEKTLEILNIEYTFFVKGNFVTTQLYPNPYFNVKNLQIDSTKPYFSFDIEYITASTFKIKENQEQKNGEVHTVNIPFNYNGHLISIEPISPSKTFESNFSIITCIHNSYNDLAPGFAGGISVEVIKGTSLVTVDFTHEVAQLASDYLNTFADIYIKETVNGKSKAAQQTIDFIDKQLAALAIKVQQNEMDLANIKSDNNGFELNEVMATQSEKYAAAETEKNILLLRKELINNLYKGLLAEKNAPIDYIIYDKEDAENIPLLLEKYNDLVLARITLLQRNTKQSAVALENEVRLKDTRVYLLKVIERYAQKTDKKIAYVNQRLQDISSILGDIPTKQQAFLNIQRDFKVNEKFYTYLFEKKLETSIAKSSITPNASVVQESQTPGAPIYPNSKQSYSMAWLLGLSIGVGIIVGTRLLYQKIADKETIERLSRIPVLGVIKKINTEESEYDIYTFRNPKSIFTESIRGIRTGLNFISKGKEHKVICVTSTVSGEGKTFCTINLASSFTMLGKKVVIIGCDLRRPKVHLSFSNITNKVGITTYLIGKSTLDEIIQHSEYENLHVITAGPTPPNPAELLQMKEMKELIDILKTKYDYVLIDSAPVGLVSDSLIIMDYADINLFILRSQYSKREFALIPDRLKAENNINNIYTILNAYDTSSIVYSSIYKNEKGGYYGGSGYYYYDGYYGKGGYGYYGRKSNNSYYSGYYNEEQEDDSIFPFINKLNKIRSLFKRKK